MRSNVASRITPVRPMPPAVAQKMSGVLGRRDGQRRRRCPVSSVRDCTGCRTCRRRGGPLPWMSLAIAPPTVTYRVPGVTGTNQPRGRSQRIEVSRLVPAPTVTTPAVEVGARNAGERGGVEHHAARVLRRVAVRAAEPTRDDAAAVRRLHERRASLSSSGVETVRARRCGATPSVEEDGRRPGARRASGDIETDPDDEHPERAHHLERPVRAARAPRARRPRRARRAARSAGTRGRTGRWRARTRATPGRGLVSNAQRQ